MRKPKPAPVPAVQRVQAALDALAAAVASAGFPGDATSHLAGLDAEADLLAMPRYASHVPHLAGLREAIGAGDRRAANRHLVRLRSVLRPAANDAPFAVGDPVSVVRSRHGWHDGSVSGRVRRRFEAGNGTVSYDVRGDDGLDYDVEHSRDLRPLRP